MNVVERETAHKTAAITGAYGGKKDFVQGNGERSIPLCVLTMFVADRNEQTATE